MKKKVLDYVEKIFVDNIKNGYYLSVNYDGLLTDKKIKKIIKGLEKLFCFHFVRFKKSEIDYVNNRSILELECSEKPKFLYDNNILPSG